MCNFGGNPNTRFKFSSDEKHRLLSHNCCVFSRNNVERMYNGGVTHARTFINNADDEAVKSIAQVFAYSNSSRYRIDQGNVYICIPLFEKIHSF